jgi:hypothetical protein
MQNGREHEVLARLTGKAVSGFARIGKGGNSKVYRVECNDGSRYVAKFYFERTMDGLDRLEVEFSGLSFLWDNGVRCIAQPLASDRESQIALYEHLDGEPVDSRLAGEREIEHVTNFAAQLKALTAAPRADQLPRAAEACFSFEALHEYIAGRLARLENVRAEGPSYAALADFLREDFAPALACVAARGRTALGEEGWKAQLPRGAWTLSPSDFGLHNALRQSDGSLVFVDFEYFGWDDPAKMIADFVLHPAMELTQPIRRAYVARMLACFAADPALARRLALIYPLFALKWCMILLNEFVPRFIARREFAGRDAPDREGVRARQLLKSRTMLGRALLNAPEDLPDQAPHS